MKHEHAHNHDRKSYVLNRVRQAFAEQEIGRERLENG